MRQMIGSITHLKTDRVEEYINIYKKNNDSDEDINKLVLISKEKIYSLKQHKDDITGLVEDKIEDVIYLTKQTMNINELDKALNQNHLNVVNSKKEPTPLEDNHSQIAKITTPPQFMEEKIDTLSKEKEELSKYQQLDKIN